MKRTCGLMLVLAVAGIAFGAAISRGGAPAAPEALAAQGPDMAGVAYKTLTVMPGTLMSPLYITKVAVGDKVMVLGTPMSPRDRQSQPNLISNARPFQTGDDWLRNMTIYIKNRSDRTVGWLEVSLWFPEASADRSHVQHFYHIRLGRMPDVDAFDGRTGKPLRLRSDAKPLGLDSGQEVVVHVADHADKIKAYVEKAIPWSNVSKVVVSASLCLFSDGMQWDGRFSLPDATHPGKWKRLPSGYFPGNPRQYWPPAP